MQESKSYMLSRRDFFKAAAGAAAGAALLSFHQDVFARPVLGLPDTISLENCPVDAWETANRSELVKHAYQQVLQSAGKIKDHSLRTTVVDIIKNPAPTIMEQYRSASAVEQVYNQLLAKNLVEEGKISKETLFPRVKDIQTSPQPFISAPGSGYGSHHAYPGGLPAHVGTNLLIAEGLLETYRQNFGYDLDSDVVLASEALHDLHKPWVFQWEENGSCLPEYTIAGTGAHHILSLAESMYRNLPSEVIVAQACAHNHPGTARDEADVVGWLQAAAILAGKKSSLFLSADGMHVPQPQSQAGYFTHLADHDWVLSVPAAQRSINALQKIAREEYKMEDLNGQLFNCFRNYIGSQISFMHLNYMLSSGQDKKALAMIRALVK